MNSSIDPQMQLYVYIHNYIYISSGYSLVKVQERLLVVECFVLTRTICGCARARQNNQTAMKHVSASFMCAVVQILKSLPRCGSLVSPNSSSCFWILRVSWWGPNPNPRWPRSCSCRLADKSMAFLGCKSQHLVAQSLQCLRISQRQRLLMGTPTCRPGKQRSLNA